MPKICYVEKKFKPVTVKLIESANAIIREYTQAGLNLTLRQLYYQFVARGLIPNSLRSYKNLGSAINDGRLAGLIDWNTITDRTRNLLRNPHWDNPKDFMDAVVPQYAVDKWDDQPTRVEVWIEKDALIGVIERVCRRMDVPYFSCRGYTSQSELWEAGQRLSRYVENDQRVAIIHLGDHDPSGKDMTRDVEDRLQLFMGSGSLATLEVNRIALNADQIEKYNPPPNPAKLTDPRAKDYIAEFGQSSWELDALDPKMLERLIERSILMYRDDEIWEARETAEEKERSKLIAMAKKL